MPKSASVKPAEESSTMAPLVSVVFIDRLPCSILLAAPPSAMSFPSASPDQ